MRSIWRALGAAGALALVVAAPARAAGPLVVDDASIEEPHRFQIESWGRVGPRGFEVWMLPAVQAVPNLELTAGGNLSRGDAGTFAHHMQVQGKTLFKPLEKNTYGVGLTLGTGLQLDALGDGLSGDLYLNVPFSLSLADDRVQLSVNVGGDLASSGERPLAATWGVGGVYNCFKQLGLLGEVYGTTRGVPAAQAGVRLWLVPDRFQLAGTWTQPFGESDTGPRFTLGVGAY